MDDLLIQEVAISVRNAACKFGPKYVTSTAELLKVRQTGDGRMNGKAKGPVDGIP